MWRQALEPPLAQGGRSRELDRSLRGLVQQSHLALVEQHLWEGEETVTQRPPAGAGEGGRPGLMHAKVREVMEVWCEPSA